MTQTIQILIVVLLCCSIVTVIRLWSVLGSARVTLANLEETRLEANETLQRLSEVAASTDKVMREEVAPTLQRTRATLENVEIATHALAQTTQSLRRLTGRAESLTTAQRLLSLGGTVAQNVFASKQNRESTSVAAPKGIGLAFAVVRGLLSGRGKADKKTSGRRAQQSKLDELEAANEIPVLPPAPDEKNVLIVGKDTR